MGDSRAIGIFDSGVGGLTVVRAVMERLPWESIIYFGDTARVPYGIKSRETITEYALQITDFLLQKNVKLLIIACNTMAAVAYPAIKLRSPTPVLDVIDAGARLAVAKTVSGRIGVIGTPATINSNAYARSIHRYRTESFVFSQSCPLFVPLVEEGWFNHPITRAVAQEYLQPLLTESIDSLVLGCTHYPLLKPLLREVIGGSIHLIDSAEAMAEIAANILRLENLAVTESSSPDYEFFVTDIPHRFQTIGEYALGRSMTNVKMAKI
ncbi:MAG: glutamate racemase [Deltaproteobacteria bacterium]|nr:glutamate racemase [Deltaproteobacteria bacterium]